MRTYAISKFKQKFSFFLNKINKSIYYAYESRTSRERLADRQQGAAAAVAGAGPIIHK